MSLITTTGRPSLKWMDGCGAMPPLFKRSDHQNEKGAFYKKAPRFFMVLEIV
jgi:hypothetical protein